MVLNSQRGKDGFGGSKKSPNTLKKRVFTFTTGEEAKKPGVVVKKGGKDGGGQG